MCVARLRGPVRHDHFPSPSEFHTRSAPAALLLWQLSLNVLRVRVALFGETRTRLQLEEEAVQKITEDPPATSFPSANILIYLLI